MAKCWCSWFTGPLGLVFPFLFILEGMYWIELTVLYKEYHVHACANKLTITNYNTTPPTEGYLIPQAMQEELLRAVEFARPTFLVTKPDSKTSSKLAVVNYLAKKMQAGTVMLKLETVEGYYPNIFSTFGTEICGSDHIWSYEGMVAVLEGAVQLVGSHDTETVWTPTIIADISDTQFTEVHFRRILEDVDLLASSGLARCFVILSAQSANLGGLSQPSNVVWID
jgi:hypothetical protein